jgi:hypothetical protein
LLRRRFLFVRRSFRQAKATLAACPFPLVFQALSLSAYTRFRVMTTVPAAWADARHMLNSAM